MKLIAAAIAALVMTTSIAGARQPSGYEVAGCGHYILIESKVVHICHWRHATVGWSSPLSAVNAGGG